MEKPTEILAKWGEQKNISSCMKLEIIGYSTNVPQNLKKLFFKKTQQI